MIRFALLDMYEDKTSVGYPSIVEILEKYSQLQIDSFQVRKGEIPDLDYDIYLSTGGNFDPSQTDYDWLPAYHDLLEKIKNYNEQSRDKKYVCFIAESYQLYASANGYINFTDEPARYGLFPITITKKAEDEQIWKKIEKQMYILDFRQMGTVNTPQLKDSQVEVLAYQKTKDEEDAMIVRFDDELFGFNFHPEVDPKRAEELLEQPEYKLKIISAHDKKAYLEMFNSLNEKKKLAKTHRIVLPTWINECIQKINLQRKLKSIMGNRS